MYKGRDSRKSPGQWGFNLDAVASVSNRISRHAHWNECRANSDAEPRQGENSDHAFVVLVQSGSAQKEEQQCDRSCEGIDVAYFADITTITYWACWKAARSMSILGKEK